MNIKLRATGENIDLASDFKLSLTLNNPMLTEQGSMSLPCVLPPSNRRRLGFPDKIEQAKKIKKTFDVVINAGSYNKLALLRVSSYNKGIVGAFYLNESEMYAKMKEVELSQAFQIIRPASDFYVSGYFPESLDMMIKYLELVMFDNIQDHFHLFPVATDTYTKTVKVHNGREFTGTYYNLINEYMTTAKKDSTDIFATDLKGKRYNKLAGRTARQIHDGENLIDVPKGYGITPFLKENFVLRRIFSYFGYELKESLFDTDPEMQKIVLVNNTADAIVKGELNYAHLVPSGTINDYLESVRTDYGCEFFVSSDHKSVEVKFWNDIISNRDFIPLDGKAAGKYIPTFPEPKILKLTGKRSLDGTAMNFDTLQKFEQNYGKLKYIKTPLGNPGNAPGFFYIQNEGRVYEASGPQWRYICPALFDQYEEIEDAEYESHESNREYLPHIWGQTLFSDGSWY